MSKNTEQLTRLRDLITTLLESKIPLKVSPIQNLCRIFANLCILKGIEIYIWLYKHCIKEANNLIARSSNT